MVAGSINMDLVARADRHPRPGETVAGRDLGRFPGGKGANQALAAARLGVQAVLLGRVGADDFGEQALGYLGAGGVDVSRVARDRETHTGTAFIVLDSGGENTIVSVHGANAAVTPDDVLVAGCREGDVAVSQLEIPLDTVAVFLDAARSAGARTVLNAAPARPVPDEVFELADVVVVNEWELAMLARSDPQEVITAEAAIEAASAVRSTSGQIVVVTLGGQGAVAVVANDVYVEPGRVVDVVDTTGAGDAFVGALASRLASGADFASALGFANAAASVAVQRMGAATSMPTAEDVAAVVRPGA